MRFFKTGDTAKRNDTGEHVQIVEVLPLGMKVFYRIEYQTGNTSLVADSVLRPVQSVAADR